MADYLVTASYSPDGVKGVLKSGGTRASGRGQQGGSGPRREDAQLPFRVGGDDAIVMVELPDNVAAAALGLAVSATGLASVKTTVLLTPTEIDEASNRQVAYTPPGK